MNIYLHLLLSYLFPFYFYLQFINVCNGGLFYYCVNPTPGFLAFFEFWHFQKLSNDWYILSRYKRSLILIQQKIIFSTSAEVGLSCDIKSLFRKSLDKKLHIFTSIFHPVFLHYFYLFYDDLIPLSNICRPQKKILNFLQFHHW